MLAYNEAIAKAKPLSSGKFADVITLYEKSAELATRSTKTQKDYQRYINLIDAKFWYDAHLGTGRSRSRRLQRVER